MFEIPTKGKQMLERSSGTGSCITEQGGFLRIILKRLEDTVFLELGQLVIR